MCGEDMTDKKTVGSETQPTFRPFNPEGPVSYLFLADFDRCDTKFPFARKDMPWK